MDVNNNVVLPAPTVTLDELNSELAGLQNSRPHFQEMVDEDTKQLQDASGTLSALDAKITALTALITTATSQGAMTMAQFQAVKNNVTTNDSSATVTP